mmetsp:Transcript_55224/g.159943  ORF Transcript_55224/g.159943 Transcript_55224/m.159943 type:complete len:335 (-) Transcript_55224:345-1349(-)
MATMSRSPSCPLAKAMPLPPGQLCICQPMAINTCGITVVPVHSGARMTWLKRESATRAWAMEAKRSGKAESGARMALNNASAENTVGACSGLPERANTAKVAKETMVGATVASSTFAALTLASRRSADNSASRANSTSARHSASQRWSFTADLALNVASVRRNRMSVAAAVRLLSAARAFEMRASIGSNASITARPPTKGGPMACHNMARAMASCNGADHNMFREPHKVLILAPSDESKLHKKPVSAFSHNLYPTARLQTAAPKAARAKAPSRNACQKYWFTSTACSSATKGSTTAKAYARPTNAAVSSLSSSDLCNCTVLSTSNSPDRSNGGR